LEHRRILNEGGIDGYKFGCRHSIVGKRRAGEVPAGGDPPRAGIIQGRVFDSGYGAALQAVNVAISDGTAQKWTQTNARGEYRIKDVRPQRYTLDVYMPGYEEYRSDLTVRPGPVDIDIAIRLIVPADSKAGLQFQGIVTGPDGKPLQGAEVVLASPFDDQVSETTSTPADGHYSLKPPRPGQYILYSCHPGFETKATTVLTGAATSVDFMLPAFHLPQ
jgi:hypothetical protein